MAFLGGWLAPIFAGEIPNVGFASSFWLWDLGFPNPKISQDQLETPWKLRFPASKMPQQEEAPQTGGVSQWFRAAKLMW